MEKKIVLTPRDMIAIKVGSDYRNKNNVDYSKIVFDKIGLLIELMNSLHEEKASVPEWKIWSEPLIYKLSFHATSLLRLFQGTEMPIKHQGKPFVVLDESSIYSLLRVVAENYLTFAYLYANIIDEKEKQFRLNVWKYCGLKQRVGFVVTNEESKKKQADEKILLNSLTVEIEKSDFFRNLNKEKQRIILKGIKPRLFNNWLDLVKESKLRSKFFENLYGFKSNHSHSEFISVFQLKSSNYQYNPNESVHFSLFLLHIIICKAIIDLKELYPSIEILFNSKEFNLKTEVEILFNIGVDKNLDNEYINKD